MTGPIEMETTVPANNKPGWTFYFIWVSWTTLYIPIGYFLSFILLSILTLIIGNFFYVNCIQHITEDYLGSYVVIPMIGLLTGLVRYGMLRPYLPHIGGECWSPPEVGLWVCL